MRKGIAQNVLTFVIHYGEDYSYNDIIDPMRNTHANIQTLKTICLPKLGPPKQCLTAFCQGKSPKDTYQRSPKKQVQSSYVTEKRTVNTPQVENSPSLTSPQVNMSRKPVLNCHPRKDCNMKDQNGKNKAPKNFKTAIFKKLLIDLGR